MNLILFSSSDFTAEKRLIFRDSRLQQIRKIHRAQLGDSVRIGEINGLMGQGIIRHIDDESVELTVELNQKPPEKLPLTVILALPRPKMLRRIVRSTAEFGVSKLIIINSYKVEKSFWQSPALKSENIHRYLLDGLQQSKDTVLPDVSFKQRFKPFVEDELPSIVSDSTALIAHPGFDQPCPHQINRAVTLAVGPEGGFTEYEVAKFIEVGFNGVHLGSRILRVENALNTLIAKLY